MTDAISRSQNAQRLLEDPTFNEALAAVEAKIVADLKAGASPADGELLMAWRLLPKIKNWLIGQVETGKVELHERELKERKPNG